MYSSGLHLYAGARLVSRSGPLVVVLVDGLVGRAGDAAEVDAEAVALLVGQVVAEVRAVDRDHLTNNTGV